MLKIAIAKGVSQMFCKKNTGIVNEVPVVYFP